MKIYDGETTRAPLINTYCGQQRQLFVFSSGINLLVQFTTLKRISSVNQNRGFSGYYEFSEKFVNLGECSYPVYVLCSFVHFIIYVCVCFVCIYDHYYYTLHPLSIMKALHIHNFHCLQTLYSFRQSDL